MSPPRRRSARLASATHTKTPKKQELAMSLSSLAERDESPVDEPTQSLNAVISSPMPQPKTPSASSPTKPPILGFTDIKPSGNVGDRQRALAQLTPSKATVSSSPFNFTFTRPAGDLGLGPEAQRMMNELREEAAKIKADLTAKREQEKLEEEQMNGRKIAQPKGKAGRFSAVHMAEFKKMDSIENHPSAFRAVPGRLTPASKGLKRTQSKANLDDSESMRAKTQNPPPSAKTVRRPQSRDADSPAKRVRQHLEDDASSKRPISRDGSFIPRPTTAGKDSASIPRSHSTLASLMTPTKSSLARAASLKTPTPLRSMIQSPAKTTLSGIPKSATIHNFDAKDSEKGKARSPARSPGRFDRVKSIFTRQKPVDVKPKSNIPMPLAQTSKTPAPRRLEKALPALPLTTPGHRFSKHVSFTPETKRAALAQNSPSPIKSGLSRSKTNNDPIHYPSLDAVMADQEDDGTVTYPDLSRSLSKVSAKSELKTENRAAPQDIPGTFTFRSDHTIRFGSTSPGGFGSSPGQASLRHVRPSIMPTARMPGSFPSSSLLTASGADKENQDPKPIFDMKAFPHGMVNKKRHRVTDDEEEAEKEAAERAAKKQKSRPVAEGDALVAPRLLAKNRGSASPKKSPLKSGNNTGRAKPTSLSLARLNMLARPKNRK
ncbi:hypothetical protein UCRPA7_386 [Phaeoacremonium minimum UCRPA7]|uniref:Erythromycin esterase n=1 Tax=Phaeoacremonium minimum (strain UCR-PA7) TaxID=1286976 RepID=R8BXI3_PHAM7|nr:hypothetical protein UCRPA7_386 [Phaeoacremonium minimum UCRPA7]EOO04111.1 hypothetical protein UCRPA7_386 [Phaeoacremonium minimum UCRPA7]